MGIIKPSPLHGEMTPRERLEGPFPSPVFLGVSQDGQCSSDSKGKIEVKIALMDPSNLHRITCLHTLVI